MQTININGIEINYSNGKLVIDGISERGKSTPKKVIVKDTTINGDMRGNIEILGNNVTIVVNGDVTGNIKGNCEIKVKGDVTGNIVGGRISRG